MLEVSLRLLYTSAQVRTHRLLPSYEGRKPTNDLPPILVQNRTFERKTRHSSQKLPFQQPNQTIHCLFQQIAFNDSKVYICCIQETYFRPRDTYRLKVRGWKKIFHANGNQKKAGVAILISDKIDFKMKTMTKDKEGHYKMIKGQIQEEDITIVNIYAPNTGAPQYIRQMLTTMKGEIDSNTIIVGNFNTPLSPMDRSSKMKINKETKALNDT